MKKKEHQSSGTLGKDIINKGIIPFLSVGKRGFKSNFDLASIILLIFKRLRTGVQWRELPIEVYFEKGEISWQNVYYYFNKWSKDGSFQHPRNGEQPDVYFDEELYKNRFKIEQANGWLDGYKGLIMRYEYLDVTWIGMLLLGFISKFLKKSLNTFVVKNVNQTDKITVNLF